MNQVSGKYGGSTLSFTWSEPGLSAMRKLEVLGLNDFDICWIS